MQIQSFKKKLNSFICYTDSNGVIYDRTWSYRMLLLWNPANLWISFAYICWWNGKTFKTTVLLVNGSKITGRASWWMGGGERGGNTVLCKLPQLLASEPREKRAAAHCTFLSLYKWICDVALLPARLTGDGWSLVTEGVTASIIALRSMRGSRPFPCGEEGERPL